MIYVLSALAGFLYGCLFCFFNHRILQYAVNKYDPTKEPQKSAAAVMKAYGLRYLLSFAALALMILIAKLLSLHFITAIIAAAIGLTLPSQIWHIKNDKDTADIWHNNSQPKTEKTDEIVVKEEKSADVGWADWESWDDDEKESR